LQVPKDRLDRFNFSNDESECSVQTSFVFPGSQPEDFRCRAIYTAMVSILDEIIGNITTQLKRLNYWDSTLIVFTADNGGPIDVEENAANNYPLRGGKYSLFEGGLRSAAFVSGGYLPKSVQGTKLETQMISIADWYVTLATVAGVPDPTADPVAAAGGIPPIDGLDMWPLISGNNLTSPRTEIPVTRNALISGQYKYLVGQLPYAVWTGPSYPNASSAGHDPSGTVLDCKDGCLFDVVNDPTEHTDIAASNPTIVNELSARLTELSKGFFSNNDTGVNSVLCNQNTNASVPCACYMALEYWNGFLGPYQE